MSNSKGNQIDDGCDAPNHESYGANEFFMGAPNDQFQTLISAETYPQHLGTATSNATSQDMVLVQHPHRCDQPEGATNLVNPSISPQINPCLLPKAGYSQSSNISNAANLEKKLKRREIDKKSRAKKEKMRKDTEEKLVQVTDENTQLREENIKLRKENDWLNEREVTLKKDLNNSEKNVTRLEKEVSHLKNNLTGQNTKVDTVSDKQAISESACSEHQEEIEKWKRKAKKRKVVIEALTRWKDAEQ